MNAELGDPLGVLSEDQAEIEAAFRAVESPSGDPVELRDKIVRRLECHGLLEREIVYPRLVEAAPDQAEMVRQARRSEKRISELVGVIEGKPLQLPETASALHQLMAEARQHIERERSEVLPALRNVLSEGQLALLGERLVEARRRVADTLSSPASRSESLRHAAAEAAVLGDGPLEERDLGRVVVLGSDGPLGAVTLAALRQQSGIGDVLGAAGQAGSIAGGAVPELGVEDLELLLQGVATVVQLPRPTAPRTDTRQLWRRDVEGTRRLLEAMRRAGVDRLVHVSSAAAYSPAPEGSQVTEDWPTDGDPRSPTSLRLAYVERMLDGFEQERSARRVVRLRPAVVLGRSPALALWRSLPAPVRASRWVRPSSSPLVPVVSGLRLQVVGARDVARACCLALAKDAVGAFNLATEPLLDAGELGRSLGAKVVPLPPVVANAVAWFAWRAGLAVGPHAVTSLTAVPMIDPGKAREQLGWVATTDSGQAIAEVLEALADGAG